MRNFLLREEGLLSIVCPISDGINVKRVAIFNAGIHEVKLLMDEDLAVKEGIFVYKIHACRGFPGDGLP